MNNELPIDVAETFTDEVCEAHVSAAFDVFEHLPTNEAEMPGFDSTCVGTTVYRTARHWVLEHCGEFGVVDLTENNALMYGLGRFTYTCQRVATTKADVRTSFPRNYRVGLKRLRDYQHGQALFDFAEEDYGEPSLVLALMGNDVDGLLAVYLCRPLLVEGGKVKSWEFAAPLYEAPEGGEGGRVDVPAPEVPPVEKIGVPSVRPRRRRDDGSAA